MGLPDQVRRQAERANELIIQANGQVPDPDGEIPKEPETPDPLIEQPPASTAVEQPTVAPVEPPAALEPVPTETNWEHKYKTLQGVFSAEQGRWQAEKKVLEGRMNALEQGQVKAPPSPAPAPTAKVSRVTDQDREVYGTELLDLISRQAAEIADAQVAQRLSEFKPELDKTRDQVTQVAGKVYQNDQEKFFGELAKSVPDWQAINGDERWLNWLAEVDPLSGVARQVYLDNASGSLDHARAAKLFDAFKDVAGLNKPAEVTPTKPALSPSPRTVGTASAPTHREPETGVRRTEIAAHYRRASTDVTYRTGTEHKAMEARIATAMATGKIVEA